MHSAVLTPLPPEIFAPMRTVGAVFVGLTEVHGPQPTGLERDKCLMELR